MGFGGWRLQISCCNESNIKSFDLNFYFKIEKAAMEPNITSNMLQVKTKSALRGLNLICNKTIANLALVSDAGQFTPSPSSMSRGHHLAMFHICLLVTVVLAISCFLKNF